VVIRRFKVNVSGRMYVVEVEEVKEEIIKKNEAISTPSHKTGRAPKQTTKEKNEEREVVICPMPARVISIKCRAGEQVKTGEVLMVIEAMKMEHNIFSPRDGRVLEIKTSEGSSVAYNQPLLIIE